MLSLSVIMPTYKRNNILFQTISSFLKSIDESYKEFDKHIGRIQLIIVNDNPECKLHSTYLYKYVIKNIDKSKYKMDISIHNNKKNLGLAGSRNVGVKKARNDWMILLDDDDDLLPSYWKYVIPFIDKSKDKYDLFYTDKYVLKKDNIPNTHKALAYNTGEYSDNRMVGNSNFLSCMQVTFNKRILKKCKFDVTLKYNEDWDWWGQLIYNDNLDNPTRVKYLKIISCNYNFRYRDNENMSANIMDVAIPQSTMEVRRRNIERYKIFREKYNR